MTELEEKLIVRVSELESGLRDIIDPMAALRREAEKDGCVLNGMSYTICNDAEHLKKIARGLLSHLNKIQYGKGDR